MKSISEFRNSAIRYDRLCRRDGAPDSTFLSTDLGCLQPRVRSLSVRVARLRGRAIDVYERDFFHSPRWIELVAETKRQVRIDAASETTRPARTYIDRWSFISSPRAKYFVELKPSVVVGGWRRCRYLPRVVLAALCREPCKARDDTVRAGAWMSCQLKSTSVWRGTTAQR